MARPEHPLPDLRASVPTLEPDDALLARLSELAAGSGTSRPPAGSPTQPGWRVGLAAASVAALVGGLGWIAAAVSGDESPPPPVGPVTQPTSSSPDSDNETGPDGVPTGRSESGAGHDGSTERGGSDPGGVSGDSVGPAPGAGHQTGSGHAAEDGGQGQDEQGNDQGQDEQGQGDQGQDEQGQQGPGQAGQDHGQQDGQGDESHGKDGEPHGRNDPPHDHHQKTGLTEGHG